MPQPLLRELEKLATETGMGRVEIIKRGMRLVARDHRDMQNPNLQGLTVAERRTLTELHRKASRSYQANLTPAERKQRAKKAAKKRWAKG